MNYLSVPNPHQDPFSSEPKSVGYHPKTMTTTLDSLSNYSSQLDRWSIGFDGMLKSLAGIASAKSSYPPYDISRKGNKFILELALAGFKEKDLQITVKDHTLTVASVGNKKEEPSKLYSGIARRNFTLNFALAEYIEVEDATLTDGILTITMKQELPEALKPKVIPITGKD